MIITFFFLYFLQGLPHGLQTRFLPLLFRSHGMSLAHLSLYKLLLIPWVLKAVWAPIVDNYGSKKTWLAWSLVALIALSVVASNISPSDFTILAVVLFTFNLVTSVQDIAVDGSLIDFLTPSQLASGNVAQVLGYKIGTLFSGGVFAWLIDLLSWSSIFYSLTFFYSLGLLVSIVSFPTSDVQESSSGSQPRSRATTQDQWSYAEVFKTNGTMWMIVFMILYKTGEHGFASLLPLFLLDEGVHAHDVGFWTGVIGQVMSALGSVLGGFAFSTSMKTALQIQLTLRALTALGVWLLVAMWDSTSAFAYGSSIVLFMTLLFFGGAITTCTFTLAMQLSQTAPRKYRASHYSILATIEVLGKLLFSATEGALAQYAGYSFAFSLFFFLSVIVLPVIFQAPVAISSL